LLQGLVLEGDAAAVVARARARGLLLSLAGANVVRFVPPLVAGRAEIDEAVSILDAALAEDA
jgi:4-aminobutyrate aminotransferase-like enzyme